ncbi:MAG: YtxH domain-containing protein [Candidatus Obscuribacter sp.]|nr:YtxH domain-containing protein [Candidatus Obscuribacter sp.]
MNVVKKLWEINAQEMKMAFSAGSALGGFVGCCMGIGVGIGIGMLVAPKSGNQLRDEIKDKTADLADKAREKAACLKDSAVHFYDDMAAKGAEALDHAKQAG